jgi:hypothetical protein
MADNSQDDLRDRLDRELAEANDKFATELYRQTSWRFWLGSRNHRLILGPYNAMQLGAIYRYILLVMFIAGVTLTVISQATRELGVALIVGLSLRSALLWPKHGTYCESKSSLSKMSWSAMCITATLSVMRRR